MYGAVGTVENLGTTPKHVQRIEKRLLSLMGAKRLQIYQLIVMRIKVIEDELVMPRKSGRLGDVAVSVMDYVMFFCPKFT